MFNINSTNIGQNYSWTVIHCSCDLDNEQDQLISNCVTAVRQAYGENFVKMAALNPDPYVAKTFNLENILKAFKLGLPNPIEEGNKPEQLKNYRSESLEVLARLALSFAHQIEFPVHPQIGKTNPNQPILGFDGWGIKGSEKEGYTFVLVQVKGTDDPDRPPKEANVLAGECIAIPQQRDAICRALSVLTVIFRGLPEASIFLSMMDNIGDGKSIKLGIAPAVIRGHIIAENADLDSIRAACDKILPIKGYGIALSIGVKLNQFGEKVMSLARAS
jgi:hypothetical protein